MTSSPPCPDDRAIWQFLNDPDLLDQPQRQHVQACTRCQRRAADLREVDELLPDICAALPSTGPPRLLAGHYELIGRLGRGGFGEVWLAQDTRLGLRVAVKILRTNRLLPGARQAFEAEARLLAELTANPRVSRHIVQLRGCEEDAGQILLVMEYVEGGSLGQRLRQFGPLNWQLAARYVADVGDALAVVHQRQLLHRDIKPDNILWDSQCDEALLADFGVSTHIAAAQGFITGTVGYLAPELRDGHYSTASDVFGLAATLYHLLTGTSPFHDRDLAVSLTRAEKGLPNPDRRLARIPAALDDALRQGLCPDPRRRVSLEGFLGRLRGGAAHSLASRIVANSHAAWPSTAFSADPTRRLDLLIRVSTGPTIQSLVPAEAASQLQHSYRDLEFVPPDPVNVQVPDGHFVQFRFSSRSGGYLTLLNIGTSGKVTIVFPNAQAPECSIPAGGERSITVRVKPPAGADEAIGILTCRPNSLAPEQWHLLAQSGQPVLDAYHGYRDLEFIAEQAEQAEPEEWAAAAVKITHP